MVRAAYTRARGACHAVHRPEITTTKAAYFFPDIDVDRAEMRAYLCVVSTRPVRVITEF